MTIVSSMSAISPGTDMPPADTREEEDATVDTETDNRNVDEAEQPDDLHTLSGIN